MTDLDKVGGVHGVMKYLLKEGMLHGDCITVTGKTLAENLMDMPDLVPNQTIVRKKSEALHPSGPLVILKGNLAPEGAVAKISGLKKFPSPVPQKCTNPKTIVSTRSWRIKSNRAT